MIRRNIFLCLCSFFLTTTTGLAETRSSTDQLQAFQGEWVSSNEAFGAPALSVMQWTPDLGERFLRLNYRIEMQTGGETPAVFEGIAFYKSVSDKELRAFWADNSGDLHPINAEWDGTTLVSHWGVIGKKQGRTRYDLVDDDEMVVTDWIKTEENWRQFNRNIFHRQPSIDP